MVERFDVIFLGLNVEESELELAISQISKVLDMPEAEFKHLVDNKINLPIKEGIPLETAKKYQTVIQRLGGVCNYRPSLTSGRKLELAPLEQPRETVLFACPACEFKQEVPSDKEVPLQCPQCGIIPGKYDKIAALKEERERIKQRLLNAHKLREQQGQELAERLEREERQRRLEEEIRKELGLPRLINTRLRLFSSAAFIWFLGMAMGGGGVGFFYQSIFPQDAGQAAPGNLLAGLEDALQLPDNDPTIPPQQDTLKQVFALSSRQHPPTQPTKDAGKGTDQQAASPSGEATNSAETSAGNAKVAHLDGKAIWQEMRQDGEWDLFLAAQASKLVDSQQTTKAYHMANAISSSRLKVKALGHLAEHFRKTNNIADGENLFNLMAEYINNLPDIGERIEAHGILALSLWRMGDGEKARQNLDTAEQLALTLSNPVDNAQALARVATYQSQIGKQAEADANFRRVNMQIHALSDKASLLGAYVKLATSYAESGSRGIALAILNEALAAAKNQVTNKGEQDRLFAEIADAYIKLGDADSAMSVINRLSPAIKENALYKETCELAYADRLYDAMKSLDKIDSPEYKARAAALISRLQYTHADMARLSATLQEKALATQAQILNPQDQSIVRGEFARYQAHEGQAVAAEEWGKKAISSALAIESGQDRDIAFAVVSANLARANQPKLAEDAKKLIVSPSLADNVGKENSKNARLFSEM